MKQTEKEQEYVVLELGSFWAYYSLWFLKEFPNTKAILIEPDNNYLEVGKTNFRLNNFEGLFFNQVVSQNLTQYTKFKNESDSNINDIQIFSLDSTLEQLNLNRIDILLCDIQGHEQYFLNK